MEEILILLIIGGSIIFLITSIRKTLKRIEFDRKDRFPQVFDEE